MAPLQSCGHTIGVCMGGHWEALGGGEERGQWNRAKKTVDVEATRGVLR